MTDKVKSSARALVREPAVRLRAFLDARSQKQKKMILLGMVLVLLAADIYMFCRLSDSGPTLRIDPVQSIIP